MPDPRPNILWICTDQQRYDTIGGLGNPAIRTPHLDRLMAEGVAFTRTYSQSPICTPSRASFLTGLYPSTVHVNRNGNAYFPASERLITRRLADAGYDCGLAGKLHLSAANGRVEERCDDGYRVFRWSHHPSPESYWPTRDHAYQQWLADQGVRWEEAYGAPQEGGLAPQGEYRPGIAARYHQTTWCAEEAIAFMHEHRDGPWLMSVNPFDPHPPLDPPAEYLDRMDRAAMLLPLWREEERESQLAFRGIAHQTRTPVAPDEYDARGMVAAYYAQIELIDDQVGRMLAALVETGQRENTIVIYCSDHGEMLGDHGLRLKGCRFYEGAVHVPLIISWPGHILQGLRSDALVELADLAPTLNDFTGLPSDEDVHGRSLAPILTGAADPAHHREFVRCEYHDALAQEEASHANMLFDGRFKIAVYHGHEVGELYDLAQDPEEFHNLWWSPEHAERKAALIARLFDAVMLATDPGQPRVGKF
ncbi:MAG: sulfatase-like hydrolase/transferase [Chloroflexi bacterium]|nr:sulfatase-like hydrolase/transferase [Chloroflexota bacterium]